MEKLFLRCSQTLQFYEEQNQKRMAIIYAIVSQFFFTAMFCCVSMLKGEYSSLQIVNMRMITGFVFNAAFCHINKIPTYAEKPSTFRLLSIRGILGGLAMTCVFTCLTLMSVSDGVVMVNTNPIWTNFLAFFFLGEHLSKKALGFCLISFIGIVLVSRPASIFGESSNSHSEAQNQLLGTIFGLVGSLFVSLVSIVVRKLSHQLKCNGAMHMQYNYFISAFFTAILILNDAERPFIFTFRFLYLNVLLSFFGFIGQLLISKAYTLEKASIISPMQYFQVVLSFLLDIFVLKNSVSFTSIAGAALIVLGSVGIIM
ncbi:integral membrane protein DUF6 containing protein (macronuclear) [Tetrahymena thermophila SB210]|uniref:Integral membrane protein DUF6 containing protein n=1 Tax=Tetrahymena thermophila (strain SB210) TaxID=312017 RepID=I7M111_TETTS|nr:integral membrane protein DUF6 containing protein [Tetrahymena thermophila SB210]EAR93814.1 integral membrane protein DUF6 containing protein [Tetrahymena thermophila SB210]|eukprot:XP_001014059.1 integral membrane protein DUF6 containing protein [Tetrahymena thermophila SB210]